MINEIIVTRQQTFEGLIDLAFEKIIEKFNEKKGLQLGYYISGKFENSSLLIDGTVVLSNIEDKTTQREFVKALNSRLKEAGVEIVSSHLDDLGWAVSMDWLMH